MSGGGADVSTKSTTPQGTDGTKGTDDRRDHERRMRALCASTSAAMREAGADADARAIAGEAVGALFEPTLRRARRLMQSELGKWSSEHLALALDIFMGIVNDEAMVAAGRSKTSSEALGALGALASCFATKPSGAFERAVVDAIPRRALAAALARGFELAVVEARAGVRASPNDVEVLAESAALAYAMTTSQGREDATTLEPVLRALYAFLTLDSAPSRDATFTAGVTLARACCDDNRPETSLEALEATFFAGARGACDGSALLRAATRVASADETMRASSFGALAVLRGFIITADDAALARRRDGDAIFHDVLPAICEFIEHGDDVHHRFHAVTCLKVALEKMKSAASMGALKTFPRDAFDRIAFVIASRWEDTFGHTVREIQTCFGLLLDIIVDSFEAQYDDYVDRVISRALRRPAEQKSKYLALRVLITKFGATRILTADLDLLSKTLDAMREASIAPAASSMLADLSSAYMSELKSISKWREWWLPCVTRCVSAESKARAPIVTYVLPLFFKQDGESVIEFTKHLSNEAKRDYRNDNLIAAVVSVLKVARNLQMVDPSRITVVRAAANGDASTPSYEVDQIVIDHAMASVDKTARLDVLEWLCLEGRRGSATLPGSYELKLLKRMVSANLRGESVSFRSAVVTLVSKVFVRMWTGVNQIGQKVRRRGEAAIKKGIVTNRAKDDPLKSDIERATEVHAFVAEIVCVLIANVYPGAPFERRCTALELLNVIADTWKTADDFELSEKHGTVEHGHDVIIARRLLTSPYDAYMRDEAFTNLLLGALVDSWEKLRMTAFDLLQRHPAPLAGIETPEILAKRLEWALQLLRSPRVRESGAAALLIRLLIRKYGFDLNWRIHLGPVTQVVEHARDAADVAKSGATIQVMESLCDLLEQDIALAERDVMKASQRSLAHGAVLLTRFALCEIDLNGKFDESTQKRIQDSASRLMAHAGRATDLALDFISQPDALGATAEEVKTLQHDDLMDDAEDVDDDASLDLAPKAQIITTACWLTVKETSLLTGEIIASSADVFSFDAIKSAGERLMKVLFAVKHTGALEKTRIGMTAVCSRLMRSDDAAMKALPQRWLEDLLDQLNRPCQGIRDRVRRSAGLPYAFMSILLAEPKGQPRLALDGALPRLLDIASGVVSSDIPRVHAFNVIRVIFADRDLTMDTTPYAARGVQVCIDAFSSPTWEIQNAATLAFASLLTKVCGYMNTVTRARHFTADGRHEVKFVEFFQRFPTLMTYLGAELEKATSLSCLETSLDVHPSLYPILALLSRLRPSLDKDKSAYTDGKCGDDFFVPLVRCMSGRYLAVRTAAARAMVPILPSTRLCEYIDRIFTFELVDKVNLNAIHGALLCFLEVINEVRRSAFSDDVCWAAFSADASRRLVAFAECAVRAPCPMISATWLRCAEAIVAIENSKRKCARSNCACRTTGDENAIGEMLRMIWQCAAPVLSANAEGHPGASEWHRTAAGARVRLTLGFDSWLVPLNDGLCANLDTGDALTALLDTISQDLPYEYRAEAYKTMFKTPITKDAKVLSDKLRHFAAENLATESRHTCARRALQCIDLWTASSDANVSSTVFTAVESITFSSINERVRSEGMRCLAVLYKRRIAQQNGSLNIDDFKSLDKFTRALSIGSAPAQSAETRRAAVDALARGDLLLYLNLENVKRQESSHDFPAQVALSTWKCALTLVEDEDVEIRAKASIAISRAVAPTVPSAHSEESLCDAFAHMHSNFAGLREFDDYCVQLARGLAHDEASFASVISNATSVRRLFDKEADNIHAEPLLLAQIAATHASQTLDVERAREGLRDVTERIECMLRALRASPEDVWVGGIAGHEACFLPISNAILGASVFAKALERQNLPSGESFRETMRSASAAIPQLRLFVNGGLDMYDHVYLMKHRLWRLGAIS